MFCPKCGFKNLTTSSFCVSCGSTLPRIEVPVSNSPSSTGQNVNTIASPPSFGVPIYNSQIPSQNSNYAPRKMSFGDAIKYCFLNYVNFKGRASRSEYWYFYLFGTLVYFVSVIFVAILLPFLLLGFLIPGLSSITRRLHDTERSGAAALIALIPIVGGIILIVWLASEGNQGANKYGPAV